MGLESRWRALWSQRRAAGRPSLADDQVTEVWTRLVECYSELHRAYHNLNHIQDCFAELDASPLRPVSSDALELAIFAHDVVYDAHATGPGANEIASAEWLMAALPDAVASSTMGRAADRLVRATAHGSVQAEQSEGVPDVDLLLDVDLAILGRDPTRYGAYVAAIRAEYRHVSDAVFRDGRQQVLRHFLGLPQVYRTAAFGARYEELARTNLETELLELEG